MKLEMKDRVVMITGSGGGIGRTMAHGFAEEGAQVIVACAFPDNREHGYGALRDAALDTACAMSRKLEGVQARQISIRAFAAPPAQALRELAITTGASLVVLDPALPVERMAAMVLARLGLTPTA